MTQPLPPLELWEKPVPNEPPTSRIVQTQIKPDRVVVGWCHNEKVEDQFMVSMMDMLQFDMSFQQRIVNGGGRLHEYSTVNVSSARNTMVRKFLDNSEAPWLLTIDSDMGFKPDLLERLLVAADPVERPIVGGLCFGATDGVLWPTLYEVGEDDDGKPGFFRWKNFPVNSIVKVGATGAGCLLMHRDALAKIGDVGPAAFPWFQETAMGSEPVGEDFTFVLRARALGIPVHVHTGAPLDHFKRTVLNLERYVAQLRLEDEAEGLVSTNA